MSEQKIDGFELKPGFKGMASDTGSDQTMFKGVHWGKACLLYTSPSPRDVEESRMPSSA